MSEPGIFETINTPRFGEIYERVRPLIVWLGLGELAWIGFWLLNSGDTTPGYMVTAVVWLVVMLAWMALVGTTFECSLSRGHRRHVGIAEVGATCAAGPGGSDRRAALTSKTSPVFGRGTLLSTRLMHKLLGNVEKCPLIKPTH